MPNQYEKLKLCQNDWSYQIVNNKGSCIICDYPIYEIISINVGVRKGYNWFEVHLDNYYKIMKPYIISGAISPNTYKDDRVNLLNYFKPELVKIFIYNYDSNWKYDSAGTFKFFWKYYKDVSLFYIYIILSPLGIFYLLFYSLKSEIKKSSYLFQLIIELKSKLRTN